jgi:hypothetical protein
MSLAIPTMVGLSWILYPYYGRDGQILVRTGPSLVAPKLLDARMARLAGLIGRTNEYLFGFLGLVDIFFRSAGKFKIFKREGVAAKCTGCPIAVQDGSG